MTTPCPTCQGRSRETVGLICRTCGTDYGPGLKWVDITLPERNRFERWVERSNVDMPDAWLSGAAVGSIVMTVFQVALLVVLS